MPSKLIQQLDGFREEDIMNLEDKKTVSGMLNWINDRIKMEVKRSTKLEKCEELD